MNNSGGNSQSNEADFNKNKFDESDYYCIYGFKFKHLGRLSSIQMYVENCDQNRNIWVKRFDGKNPLLPPFNAAWQMAQEIQVILETIPSQELVLRLSGEPFFYYYLLRMLTWIQFPHDIRLISTLETSPAPNYLTDKMGKFVLKMVSDFEINSELKFPTDYLDCPKCPQKEVSLGATRAEIESVSIDIIVPTKNIEKTMLLDCVKSILVQMQDGDCLFLLDDNQPASKACEEIAEEFSQIQLFPGSRKGIGSTRTKGAMIGNNPLVAFIDSDDYILPNFLELQRVFHKKYPEVAATGSWIQAFGQHELIYPQWDGFSPLGILACLPPAGVLMWKRSAIRELGYFNEEFHDGFEDFDLVARAIALKHKIFVFDFPLYRYRRGHASLSQTWSKERELELFHRVAENLLLLCPHEFNLFLKLSSTHGNKLMISQPDLLFGFTLFPLRKTFRESLNNSFVKVIQHSRNIKWLRILWNQLPSNFRVKMVNFLIR